MSLRLTPLFRQPSLAIVAASLVLALLSTRARATEQPSPAESAAREAYIQWLQSGAETENAAAASAEKFAAYQKAVAGWRAKLEQDLGKESPDSPKRAQLTTVITQLGWELLPPLDAKAPSHAIAYALDGLWDQAGEEAAKVTTGRTMLDEIIAGYSALANKRWVDASNFFRKVDRAPLKGWLLKSVGRIAEANPKNPEAEVLMADAMLRAGLTQHCCAYLHSAGVQKSVGQSPFGGTVKTVALIRLGDFERAKSFLNADSTFEKDNPRRSFFLGVVALLEKQFNEDQAMPLFQKAIDLDKEFLPARVALAAALVNMGKADDARALFSACGDAIASYPPALINLAAARNLQPPSGGAGEKGLIGAFRGWADAREYYYSTDQRRSEIRSTWDTSRLSGMKDGLMGNAKFAQKSFDIDRANTENKITSEIGGKVGFEGGRPTALLEGKFKAESTFKPNLAPHFDIQNQYRQRLNELGDIKTGGGPQGVILNTGTSADSNSPTLRMGETDGDRVELAKAKTPVLDLILTMGGE